MPSETGLGYVYCILPSGALQRLLRLIWLDPADNSTFLANGNWRDSDSTAEFLCHALEAVEPSSGKRRIELPEFAVRPAPPPPSDTEGLPSLRSDDGVVLNNLPAAPVDYVERSEPEYRLRAIVADVARRHLVTVRAHGGMGKTSLILRLCHELVRDPDTCPYDAVVWMSARDIHLTLRGPRSVRKRAGSCEDVWLLFAELFGQEDLDLGGARAYFEATLRDDRILLVIDNFETFKDQQSAYEYFDAVSYPPSKIVITSRHDFHGDFTFAVPSMSFPEAAALLVRTARSVGAEPLMTDLDAQARELSLRSLIELTSNGHLVYDMPTMAREFAQKFLSGHELAAEVVDWVAFVSRWTGLERGRVTEAASSLFRAIRDRRAERDVERMLSAMRTLADFDSTVWVLLARAEKLVDRPSEVWEDSYKRAVEESPGQADILWEWSQQTHSVDRQIALRVQAVGADEENLALASGVADFLNGLFARQRERYTLVKWASLMAPVIEALEAGFEHLDGEALSRLAWLYIHSRQSPRVKRVVLRGLDIEPSNKDIRKLAKRQRIDIPAPSAR
jgi:hypothetical protein